MNCFLYLYLPYTYLLYLLTHLTGFCFQGCVDQSPVFFYFYFYFEFLNFNFYNFARLCCCLTPDGRGRESNNESRKCFSIYFFLSFLLFYGYGVIYICRVLV